MVEGNHYFPPDGINHSCLQPSEHQTVCSWKGTASYYDVVVDGELNKNAAGYYPQPKAAAATIKNHVAFWGGIKIEP